MLNDFISAVKNSGLAKTSIFEVQFALPALLKSKRPSANLTQMLMFCDSVALPGITMSTNQVRTYGELRENPYEKLYDNITMTFYVDAAMEVKSVFDDWMGIIQDPASRNFNYYQEYTTDIVIKVLDAAGNARYKVTLYEAYIKNLQPIQMDYGSKEIMKVSVNVNYKYWLKEDIASSDQSKSSSFGSKFSFFDDLPIPKDYFTDFSDFQGKFNIFNGSIFDVEPKEFLDSVTDSGIKQDIKQNITSIQGNLPQFGDNFNFDFNG